MDGEEGHAALGCVLGLILVLANAAINEKAHELVEQVAQVLFQKLGVEHADVVQVLELGQQLGESAEVARGTALVYALYGFLGEEAREQRKLEQLVEQTREGVVGVLRQHRVALGQRARPVKQGLIFGLAQFVRERLEALVVVVVPDGQRDPFGPCPHLGELREEEDQRSDHQANFLALEEHVRAGREYGYALGFQKACQGDDLVVLHRAEQEGHLVPVRQLAGGLQAVEKGQYLSVPVGCVALVVTGGQSYRCGHVRKVVLTRHDLLGEAKDARAIVPSLLAHPLVIEADDVRVRAVVDGQLYLLALAVVEDRREFQNVANGGPAKAVQALVVVSHHAQIVALARQQQ